MHLWHKWKTVETRSFRLICNGFLTNWKDVAETAVAEIQVCAKCGAERGWIHRLNGEKQACHPAFLRKVMKP